MPTPPRSNDGAALERFIRDGGPSPDGAALTRAHLAPLAFIRLPADDPARAEHRGAFTRATARHLAHKLAFVTLARAWREAGIEVLVFKGFYLAEFVYEHPAMRPYGDVDVLIRPEAWPRAEAVASALGWTVVWRRRDSLYRWSHEEAILTLGTTVVEVHRLIVDCNGPDDARQRSITQAAWAASNEVAWEDTAFRALAPVDSVLMGLVLARAWSGGDDWHLKPSDYLDLQMLGSAFGVALADVRTRAAQLGCSRSLSLILQRCDPWRTVLDLEPPTGLRRWRWYAQVAPERGHLGIERALGKVRRLPGTFVDVLRHLPRLVRAEFALRRGEVPTPTSGADQALSRRPRGTALAAKERIVRGVKWGARLVAAGRDPCRLRSRALFEALRATPYSVRLFEGRAANGGPLHAWVEVDGVVLRDLHDVPPCPVEQVVACYPSDPSRLPTDAGIVDQ